MRRTGRDRRPLKLDGQLAALFAQIAGQKILQRLRGAYDVLHVIGRKTVMDGKTRWKVTVSRTIEQRSELIITANTPTEAMDRAIDFARSGIAWFNVGPALTGPSPSVVPLEKLKD
jgi:hypothetical protein